METKENEKYIITNCYLLGRGDICQRGFHCDYCVNIPSAKCTLKEAYEAQRDWAIRHNMAAPYNTPFNFEVLKESEIIEVW